MNSNNFLPHPERPDKKIKIEERFLLDLRTKINKLEKQLTETKKQLFEAQDELATLHEFEQSKKAFIESTLNLESITDEFIIKEIEKRDDVIKSQKAYIKELEAVVLKSRDKPQISNNQKEPIYKVFVLGDPSVRKTELIFKFGVRTLDKEFTPTVGVNIVKKTALIKKENKIINLMFWDIAGQPEFYMIYRPYFNDADAVILTFDITRSSSFSNVNNWWQTCIKYGLAQIPRILIGILQDENSEEERKIILPMAQHLSEKLDAPYFEVVLHKGENFNIIFQTITELAYRYKKGGN